MGPEEEHVGARLRGMIQSGAEIAGGAVGGALGFLAGGPAGAFVLGGIGSAVAAAFRHVGEETSHRLLGPREKVRIGAVLALTTDRIRERIEQGERVRSDGFFDASTDAGMSDGAEVAESVLSKAQREAEEKKLPYMANLLASVSFDPTVCAAMAHQLAKIAESLTYRQLVLLRTIPQAKGLSLRTADYRSVGNFSKELYQLLHELLDLERRGFLGNGGHAVLGITDLRPGGMTIQGIGADLYNLMRLQEMPVNEATEVVRVLRLQ